MVYCAGEDKKQPQAGAGASPGGAVDRPGRENDVIYAGSRRFGLTLEAPAAASVP